MKQILNGSGADTTATVVAWLKANKAIFLAHLYLIGEPEDPNAYWLTDYEAPLNWPLWGTFLASNIKRGQLTTEIGLTAEKLSLEWAPLDTGVTASIETASPYQRLRVGFFDNRRVRIWRCYMPTPGDANTFGACELFAGYIGDVQGYPGLLKMEVNSYLYFLNQKVPTQLIEVTNTLASYSGGGPPPGSSAVSQFSVFAGSSTTALICDQTSPTPDFIPNSHEWRDTYVVFNGGAGATLEGMYSIIGDNLTFEDGNGNKHTEFQLLSPLPWAPTPGVDTFYVTGQAPINQADGDYYGFPYVPAPQTAA